METGDSSKSTGGKSKYRGLLLLVALTAGAMFLLGAIGAISIASMGTETVPIKASPVSLHRKFEEIHISGEGRNKILVISVKGVISGTPQSEGLFEAPRSMAEEIEEQLRAAEKDPRVKAVILQVNSPGGEITTTDTIYNSLVRFKKKTGKKIVAVLGSIAASGGYYIAVSADRIIAHPTTMTGSIGVIMTLLNVEGLFKKIGLKEMVFKSGRLKDMGSPFRGMTEEEKKLFSGMIREMYERFVEVVSKGRKMNKEAVERIADGRVMTARQAVETGLVDSVGYFEDAVKAAMELAGLKQAKVIRYKRGRGVMEWLFGSARFRPMGGLVDLPAQVSTPRLWYLCTVGMNGG